MISDHQILKAVVSVISRAPKGVNPTRGNACLYQATSINGSEPNCLIGSVLLELGLSLPSRSRRIREHMLYGKYQNVFSNKAQTILSILQSETDSDARGDKRGWRFVVINNGILTEADFQP